MIKCLIHPITFTSLAELDPGKEIIISDKRLLNAVTRNGITVTPEFKKLHQLNKWRVYPTDDKRIFALAFEQISFVHGLQQQGYSWENKEDYEITDEELKELARQILTAHKDKSSSNDSDDVR